MLEVSTHYDLTVSANSVLDGQSQPRHNLSPGPPSENFLPGGLLSSFRVAWPHPIHLGVSGKG